MAGGTSVESDLAGTPCLSLRWNGFRGCLLSFSSDFISASAGFQFASKLTMGRPGLSLTAVGVGSLGLLSFSSMLVALLISSLLISKPSLVLASGVATSFVFAGGGFAVYAGFRD